MLPRGSLIYTWKGGATMLHV